MDCCLPGTRNPNWQVTSQTESLLLELVSAKVSLVLWACGVHQLLAKGILPHLGATRCSARHGRVALALDCGFSWTTRSSYNSCTTQLIIQTINVTRWCLELTSRDTDLLSSETAHFDWRSSGVCVSLLDGHLILKCEVVHFLSVECLT